jgi:osmoprotectant transport system ATP-binding protein
MIRLESVTKTYPRSATPAVDNVTFEVPAGETCILIGPSGSGKTTTLKMINRLIEPTGGTIFVADKDIMQQEPVHLRRGIGYVIQQIGLFPHLTIRDNIALVPELVGWKKARIDERVDELLEMIGLDPAIYRTRYPRELSGGQRQRVGVARALAADPPVMLMDEPFGAIDPITRDRLQNEFLRLQKRLRKTIVFVTHDIDEALKMGTLICILREGGTVAQFDTPATILAEPADDFVTSFVGADRGLKRLNLVRVGDVVRTDIEVATAGDSSSDLLERMQRNQVDSLFVVDQDRHLLGYVTLEDVQRRPGRKAGEKVHEVIVQTEEEATMKDAFSEMLSHGVSYMPVVGPDKRLVGFITAEDAQDLIRRVVQSKRSSPAIMGVGA